MKRFALTYKVILSSALLLLLIINCNDRDDYVAIPVVISVQPDGASPGQSINVFGGNFSPINSENIVTINDVPATVIEAATNKLVVVVPDNATNGVLSVSVNGQTAVAPNLFNVIDELMITSIIPNNAFRLDTIKIQGQYLGETIADNIVEIQGINATVVDVNLTELTVIVPENTSAGIATVSVNANNQSVSIDNFEIIDYPPFTFLNPLTAPIAEDLKKISIASANVAYAVGDNGVILKSTAPNEWIDVSYHKIPTGDTDPLNFRDIHAFDEQNALACGYGGLVVKTTDGGATWTEISANTTENLRRLYFISNNEGWLVGSNGVIFKTQDGGDTWQSLTSGVTASLYGVFFLDTNNGFVVGNDDHFLKTTDGGNTWNTTLLATREDLTSVVIKDPNIGWVTGEDNVLLGTTDGGATWTDQSISLDSSGDDFNDIVILSDSNIIAIADDHQLAKSEDAGATWTIVDLESTLGIVIDDHLDGIDGFKGKAITVGEKGFIGY